MIYSLGDLTIDTGRQLVGRADDPIALPKLSYDLLLVLVRAAPNVVSLDELMRLVWPAIIVSPETISQRVKLLRDALGDDPRGPRYIAGLRGRGYQIVAAVKEIDDNPAAAAISDSTPTHSIAVLPFVNMSGDASQEYFSDGLTEELLNSLSRMSELQVAARTSSFSFKGKDTDIGTIARKLNVGAVLEGAVRRSANTIRITAQLINAVSGFHLWSQTYDRDLGDVLKLQTEIATAVAGALKVTLLGDVAAKVELGGTRNPAAFDAYLRSAKAVSSIHEAKELPTAIAGYTEAIHLDPHYALAFAARSMAFSDYARESETEVRESFNKAQADARQVLALAPDLAEAHLALAYV
jgi:adenylate cyclase